MTGLTDDQTIDYPTDLGHPVIRSSGHPLSLTGRPWVFRPADDREVMACSQKHGLSDVLARILVARGIAADEVEVFLNPTLKNSLPDPAHLLDMDVASTRVATAIEQGETMAIFGDYDVDGATSSALLMRYFRALGSDPIVYIPDRMKEGYGPNSTALLALKEQGASLVITVDCGTMSFEPLEDAHNAGLDVVVIDHHIGASERPKATAIVNPNRLDEHSPHGQMAAVGVAFLLAVAVNRKLRERGFFSSLSRGEAGRGASEVHHYPLPTILHNARELRKNMTDAEGFLWEVLRGQQLGAKFRKQHPVGHYITDFACLSPKLIVELDGGQHAEEAAIIKDRVRTQFLEAQGFKVLRFWNHDVMQNTEAVLEVLYRAIHTPPPVGGRSGGGREETPSVSSPHPNPPPTGEGITEPDLRHLLDLVALGTVCDVVPLTGVNRALVAQGLKIMAGRQNLGIRTLLDNAAVTEAPGVYTCGFVLGPRINAGGRVGKSDLGVRLLTTEDAAEALVLARELELHNSERKAIESMVLEEAMAMAEAMDVASPMLLVAGKGWHPGVIGIVAGRLKERFHKPVAVVALDGGIGKASARSVSGVDFGAAVIAAREAGLLLAGGGHAMAAGFTVEEAQLPALAAFFAARMAMPQAHTNAGRRLLLDGIMSIGGATPEMVAGLERLGPFGQGNPSIRLMLQGVVNMRPEVVGEHHVKTFLIDRLSNVRLSAISFRTVGTPLGEALLATRGKTVDVAGQLRVQEWNGRQSVSLMIDDVAG